MDRCAAKKKSGGLCTRPAGWGTPHKGKGRCKHHGGLSTGPKDRAKAAASKKGNTNSRKTGEYSRAEQFAKDCAAAPVDPTTILQEQARRTAGRLTFMYALLHQTEQRLVDLAAAGDDTALHALAVVEIARKQEPKTVGEGEQLKIEMADVELSTKSRSLLDLWQSQHDAITRVELLQRRTAESLKPKGDGPAAGGIGTLIINNSMPGVDD